MKRHQNSINIQFHDKWNVGQSNTNSVSSNTHPWIWWRSSNLWNPARFRIPIWAGRNRWRLNRTYWYFERAITTERPLPDRSNNPNDFQFLLFFFNVFLSSASIITIHSIAIEIIAIQYTILLSNQMKINYSINQKWITIINIIITIQVGYTLTQDTQYL